MTGNPRRSDHKARTEQQGAGKHGAARADALDPLAEQGAAAPQKEQRHAKDEADLDSTPVARCRGSLDVSGQQVAQRLVEHAVAIDLTDGQMDSQRGRGTSQRLKPGGAMVLERSRNDAIEIPSSPDKYD
jgi:hypothetical protein